MGFRQIKATTLNHVLEENVYRNKDALGKGDKLNFGV